MSESSMEAGAPKGKLGRPKTGTLYKSADGSHFIVRVTLADGRRSRPMHLKPGITEDKARAAAAEMAGLASRGLLVQPREGAPVRVSTITEIPNGAELTSIVVRINPADNALPTNNISLGLVRIAHADGATTNVASFTDALTGAAYQAEHDLVLDMSGTPYEFNNELYSYILRISGESGGDDDDVELVSAPAVTYTIGVLDLGGC